MAFLKDIDLDVADRKSERVHLWYLFEQYKTLEQNQVEAAQKLRDRTFQDRMLYCELTERRSRRKLFTKTNKRGLRHMDSKSFSLSSDNFYESFSQIHDCESMPDPTIPFTFEADKMMLDDWSSKDSIDDVKGKLLEEDIHNSEEQDFFMNEEVEIAKHTPEDNQEYYVDEYEDDIWDNDSVDSYDKITIKSSIRADNSVFEAWSKLVSFACQAIQLNHGNCFYDCSSHLLTAVLVCDILMRGVGNVCNVLQPFVSPVKYDDDIIYEFNRKKIRKCSTKKNLWKNKFEKVINKKGSKMKPKYGLEEIHTGARRQRSEVLNKMSLNLKRSSELWDSLKNKSSAVMTNSDDILDIFDENMCSNCIFGNVRNPMMELIHYMDKQLETCQQLSKRIG